MIKGIRSNGQSDALSPALIRYLITAIHPTVTTFFRLVKSISDCCIGYLRSKFRFGDEPVYVIGSNYGGRVDSNAVCLARYILERGDTVVVIGKWGKELGAKTVKRGSISAAYYLFSCRACFYTHSFSDIVPHGHKLSFLNRTLTFPPLVFLQHGVIGLKSELSNGVSLAEYLKSLEPTFDLMVVSSARERQIVSELGIDPSKLVVTGLPRFDQYQEAAVPTKSVLVFFTWQSNEQLHRKMTEVRNSSAVRVLERSGYQIIYGSHDMQQTQSGKSDAAWQASISDASLLITDDSSMAWDFFYRGQEVIFYQPWTNWFSNDAGLLERCCNDQDSLLEKLNEFLRGREPYNVEFIHHREGGNCARVIGALNRIAYV